MLRHLDTVLGFSLVMLLLSLLVTTLVQAVIVLLNLRGWHLARGLARLFVQVWPDLDRATAGKIARAVLKHPAVAHTFNRATSAVGKEELVQLVEDLVANPLVRLEPTVREALRDCLGRSSLPESLERWFDVVMLRTTERFVASTRAITVLVALVGALGLHIDALSIYSQLATSEELRVELLQKLENWQAQTNQLLVQPQPSSQQPAQTSLEEILDQYDQIRNELAQLRLQLVPSPLPGFNYLEWLRMDPATQGEAIAEGQRHLLGTLMTVVFLSLGAPFWYNVLHQVATLRPIVAQRRDPKPSLGRRS